MKGNRSYIIYLSVALGLFILVKLLEPRGFDWTPTCDSRDKNPYGAWVLSHVIDGVFKDHKINYTNLTPYELKDSLRSDETLFILSPTVHIDGEDTDVLLHHVEQGGVAFISAQSFFGKLADTLRIRTRDYLFERSMQDQRTDTTFLQFSKAPMDTSYYSFSRNNIHHYFLHQDKKYEDDSGKAVAGWRKEWSAWRIVAVNEFGNPITLRRPWGKGFIMLNCTPLAFTNINILRPEANSFASTTLSYLPERNVRWLEYYSVGRRESATPLRFILRTPPLAWAYYLTVVALLLFLIFESKRKQRIIPVIPPLQNTSLEFVTTLGNLYYHRGDHRDIAEKKILYFFDQLRSQHHINPLHRDEFFFQQLSRKTGHSLVEVSALFKLIDATRKQTTLTPTQLIELNNALEHFSRQA